MVSAMNIQSNVKEGVLPSLVTDADELRELLDRIHGSLLDAFNPHPVAGVSARELRLYADYVACHELAVASASGKLAVAVPGERLASRHGAAAGVVWIEPDAGVSFSYDTHDRLVGATVSRNWYLDVPTGFPAPAWARADLPVPASVDELIRQFTASIRVDGDGKVTVVADTVVPVLFGASSLAVTVADGVQVRALASCAGHNVFTREVPAVPDPEARTMSRSRRRRRARARARQAN
jgi:hypothetical protein